MLKVFLFEQTMHACLPEVVVLVLLGELAIVAVRAPEHIVWGVTEACEAIWFVVLSRVELIKFILRDCGIYVLMESVGKLTDGSYWLV